jgi:putative ABC transport system permease protein
VATTPGILLLAPLSIRSLSAAGRHSPIAMRLALRDLARHQLRSAAALSAVTLAIGIAAAITISSAAEGAAGTNTVENLAANQLIVYLSGHDNVVPVPQLTTAQRQAAQSKVGAIATALGTHDVLALEEAIDPSASNDGPGGKFPAALAKVTPHKRGFSVSPVGPAYVATPALLARYGIDAATVNPSTDILTSRTDVGALELFAGPRNAIDHPKVQVVALPHFSSSPHTLITIHAMNTLGLRAATAAWLVESRGALTTSQIDSARTLAATAGLTIETKASHQSLAQLRNDATGAGMLLALGVLAMSVGLIRSEGARDLRTLAATGASSTIRRTLTAATAGWLALLGTTLGTAGAYLALIAWYHAHLHRLMHVPVVNLAALVVGLPVLATAAGWLLGGRESRAISRQPLD